MSEIVASITRVSATTDRSKARVVLVIAACCLNCAGAPGAVPAPAVTSRDPSRSEAPTAARPTDAGPPLHDGATASPRSVPAVASTPNAGEAASKAVDPSQVRVTNIGLHVGGGPNDRATKAPFIRAIAEKFDAFRACYATSDAASQRGTFGIDLLVPAAGGHAEATNARTRLGGPAFRDCVVNAFRDVNFTRPRLGATKISYALQFDPQ